MLCVVKPEEMIRVFLELDNLILSLSRIKTLGSIDFTVFSRAWLQIGKMMLPVSCRNNLNMYNVNDTEESVAFVA